MGTEADRSSFLSVEADLDGPVLRLCGELDISSAPEMRECLFRLPDQVVTIDFSEVTFIDAAIIGVLVAAQQHLRDEGRKLVIYGMSVAHIRLLKIVELDDYFDSIIPN